MRIADELLLLAYSDDDGTAQVSNLDLGLAGAVLVELALDGRVDLREGRVVLVDRGPTGDPVFDTALSRIATDPKPRKPKDWARWLGVGLRDQLLDGLVDAGVLRRDRDKVLWVFPRTRYPADSDRAESAARARLAAALTGGPVDARTSALAALVVALDMERTVFPDRPRKDVRAGLTAAADRGLADDGWAAEGVRKAVEEVQTAIMLAITGATTSVTLSTGNN